MNTRTDRDLLKDYAENRSEPAFTQLVQRHIDLVHSAAVRMTNDAHSAQDVTQAVFVALARNAAQLQTHPVISGWLHTTARNLAAKNVRAAVRRQNHEHEAAAMTELLSSASDASWEEIAPHLDAALGELTESDRDAVMLRYFERKTAKEVGDLLGISDDAAQKRVSRAVERLREFFAKRGVTISVSGLVVAVSANAVQAAPIGLAITISTAALAGTAITTSTTVATTTKIIAMTTLQKTLVTATVAVLAGAGIYEAKQARDARSEIQTLKQQQAPLTEQIQLLQNGWNDATNRMENLLAENTRLKSDSNQLELLKLRGEIARFQNDLQSLAQLSRDQSAANQRMSNLLVFLSPLAGQAVTNRIQRTDVFNVQDLKDVGSQTLDDTMQTILYAYSHHDSNVFQTLTTNSFNLATFDSVSETFEGISKIYFVQQDAYLDGTVEFQFAFPRGIDFNTNSMIDSLSARIKRTDTGWNLNRTLYTTGRFGGGRGALLPRTIANP